MYVLPPTSIHPEMILKQGMELDLLKTARRFVGAILAAAILFTEKRIYLEVAF